MYNVWSLYQQKIHNGIQFTVLTCINHVFFPYLWLVITNKLATSHYTSGDLLHGLAVAAGLHYEVAFLCNVPRLFFSVDHGGDHLAWPFSLGSSAENHPAKNPCLGPRLAMLDQNRLRLLHSLVCMKASSSQNKMNKYSNGWALVIPPFQIRKFDSFDGVSIFFAKKPMVKAIQWLSLLMHFAWLRRTKKGKGHFAIPLPRTWMPWGQNSMVRFQSPPTSHLGVG